MNRRKFICLLAGVGAVIGATQLRGQITAAEVASIAEDAIRRGRVLRISYAGHTRLVEPHALGHSPGGHRALLAWQFEGGSRSTPPTGWRTFILAEVREISITVRGFARRPSYRRDNNPLRSVELDIDGDAMTGSGS